MKDEYIIINKTALQKRIGELEKQMQEHISLASKSGDYDSQFEDKLEELKQLLTQSTPLIPEIEKAIDAPNKYPWSGDVKKDYITNLKLDI